MPRTVDPTTQATRAHAVRTYPCGCEILRFGRQQLPHYMHYELSYCRKHRRVDVLCDQVRLMLEFLRQRHFSPPRVAEMIESLEASLTWVDAPEDKSADCADGRGLEMGSAKLSVESVESADVKAVADD